jgi:hypothetical protein
MSISYNGIVGNKGKVTLPSVESWGTNNNILRDPPKSIMTRRIDKVNQDGSLNEMMYESGDRWAENLNVYARGVNPMVSVQYSNKDGAPVKQPYRIMDGGAFRPPQLRQEQLLPLSRLPRNVTHAITNKEFVDYTKRVTCPLSQKGFKEPVKGMVTPTKYVKVAMPVKEHFEINYINENPVIATATTNLGSHGNTQTENKIPTRQTLRDPLQYAHIANKSHRNITQVENPEMELRTPLQYAHSTNLHGQNGQTYIHDDIELDRNMPMVGTDAVKTTVFKTNLEADNELALTRNLPEYVMSSAKTTNVTFISDDNNTDYELKSKTAARSVIGNKSDRNYSYNFTRDVNLPPTIHPGEYAGTTSIPALERNIQYNSNYNTEKLNLARSAQKARFG